MSNKKITASQHRTWAKLGNLNSQYELGKAYETGNSVKQNIYTAVKWYEKAAENNHAKSQYKAGKAYDEGRGAIRDIAEALYWYEKATEQGHKRAKQMISTFNEKGDGKVLKKLHTRNWFEEAAKNNHSEAIRRMSLLYADPNGIYKYNDKALEYVTKSAELGNAYAQLDLAVIYGRGLIGTKKDFIESNKWYRIAAFNGCEAGSEQINDSIVGKSQKDIEEAKKLVNEWLDEHN